ncbi:MAG: GyrI-like domain-containing protein [Bacteroidota bacterium]|nr:GyrI-like domain-containing protein [Bacteroidota bacterium]
MKRDPRIRKLKEKKLAGKRMTMSLKEDRTPELWASFMNRRIEILNTIGSEYYSMQIYGADFFKKFNPVAEFEKWATVEVTNFELLPPDLDTFILHAGLYASFIYRGLARDAGPFFEHIFRVWLPGSAYELDDRPHFEILGSKYRRDSSNSEEEVWIPIKPKE